MTIDSNENLIFNDFNGKTQCITKEQLKNAWELYASIKPQSFCANYERDNVEENKKHTQMIDAYSPYAKWITSDTVLKGSKPLESLEEKILQETLKKQVKSNSFRDKKELLKVYLAIPYSGMEESSYTQATEATMLIINEYGYNVFSPITHSHPIAKLGVKGTWDYWQNIDYQFIDWAEEVWVLVPEQGLTKCFLSTGVTAEMKYAEKHNKRIKLVTKKDNKIVEYGSC